MIKWVPIMAPVGKRRPGGKVVPFMAPERSWMVKSVSGRGENTSSSRLTSVNCKISVSERTDERWKCQLRCSCCKDIHLLDDLPLVSRSMEDEQVVREVGCGEKEARKNRNCISQSSRLLVIANTHNALAQHSVCCVDVV